MVLDDLSLKGKVAIVTGGGTGIGSGILMGLAEAGADIACVYSSHEPKEMKEYVESLGRKFIAIKANVENRNELDTIVDETLKAFGHYEILVNNAGICPRSSALDYPEEMWDKIININENAVFFLSQKAARYWVKNNIKGKIINLASMMSYLGGFNTSAYTASKHAVQGITRVLASELGQYGICVNALAPGWIKTNLSSALVKDKDRYDSVRARIPMGDWGTPEVFKGVAAFLGSSASDYVTGVTIPVDGGYLTK